jgi:hypothetical protein
MFLGLLDPDPDPLARGTVRIRILYYQAKTGRETLILTVLGLLFDFLSLKNDVKVPSKSNKQKNLKKLAFCGILKVNDENSMIRILIWIH